jgi:FlaG/FlaF family flagellin (archaellin)
MTRVLASFQSRRVLVLLTALAAIGAVGAIAVGSVLASPVLVTVLGSGHSAPTTASGTAQSNQMGNTDSGGGCRNHHHW